MQSDQGHELARRLARLYGYEPSKIFGPLSGYRNKCYKLEVAGNRPLNLIIYKRERDILNRIRAAHKTSLYLQSEGFPVRFPLSQRIAKLSDIRGEKYACIYNYLPGETIAWEAYEKRHIKLLGKSLSDMHSTLSGKDSAGLPDVSDEHKSIIKSMKTYFKKSGVQNAIERNLGLVPSLYPDVFVELVEEVERLGGKQPIHMDFVRSNILFSNTNENNEKYEISGILDFEKAACGHPLFDIARTLAFLLVDCKYKSARQVRKYFIDSGYNKRGKANISPKQKPLLEKLVGMYLFYDFYKFLRHNPYEYLDQNEHFNRTLAYLAKRRLVLPTTGAKIAGKKC